MKYYNVIQTNKIVTFDGLNITVYDKSFLGSRFIPNILYWSGLESDLISKLKSQLRFKASDLGEVLNGES